MIQELIIIRGLPGSGKSTLAAKIADLHNWINDLRVEAEKLPEWAHYETDMFFMNNNGKYQFKPELLDNAHLLCQTSVRGALEAGYSVIVSNTFSRLWEMKPYLDMAKEYGAKVTVLTCEGNYGNTHNVPEESIEKMRKRWEKYSG